MIGFPPQTRVKGVGRQHHNMMSTGGFGTRWMTDLINNIVKEGCIPDDWRKSILVPVDQGKGDPIVCGSYRVTGASDEGA